MCGALLGGFALACFVLQQFLVPLHLAFHHHIVAGGAGEHVHSSADHRHDHGGPHAPGSTGSDHDTHPAEDHHLELIAGPIIVPTPVHALAAPAADRALLVGFDLPSRERPLDEVRAPRPPPPRTAAAPRAPPIAS